MIRPLTIALALAVALLLSACGRDSSGGDAGHEEAGTGTDHAQDAHDADDEDAHADSTTIAADIARASGIGVAAVAAGTIADEHEVQGLLTPVEGRLAQVAARYPGPIRSLAVNVGDRVRAGAYAIAVDDDRADRGPAGLWALAERLRADLATKTRELAEMEHRAESAERDVERLRRKIDGIRPSVNRRAIEASLQCTEQRERAEKAEKALMEFGAVLGRVARENHAEALLRLVDERGDLIRRSDTAERELAEARAQLAESRAEGERLRAEAARWQSLAEQWSAGLIHQSNGLVEERDSLRTQLEQAQQRIAELTKPRNARVRRVPEKCPKDPKCVRGKRHRGGCMDWRDNVLLPEKVSP